MTKSRISKQTKRECLKFRKIMKSITPRDRKIYLFNKNCYCYDLTNTLCAVYNRNNLKYRWTYFKILADKIICIGRNRKIMKYKYSRYTHINPQCDIYKLSQ
jgi:hypothetical protein